MAIFKNFIFQIENGQFPFTFRKGKKVFGLAGKNLPSLRVKEFSSDSEVNSGVVFGKLAGKASEKGGI